MKSKATLFLLLLGLAGIAPFSKAQDGTLDVTYGDNGRVLLPQVEFLVEPFLALDAQNRAVVCSSVGDAFYAARLLPNGQLDSTFGTGGVVRGQTESDLNQDITFGMALPGNKTLLVINAYNQDTLDETRIIVLDSTGKLDVGFGKAGILRLNLSPGSGEEYLSAGLVQPDGKIVLAGNTTIPGLDISRGIVLRLHPNGTLDSTFNGDGRYDAPISLVFSLFSSIVLQPDGKLIVGGITFEPSNLSFLGLLLRLNSNGQLDLTFGSAGIVRLSALSSQLSGVTHITRAADGKLLLTGVKLPNSDSLLVLRLNANGSVDNSFGVGGIAGLFPEGTQQNVAIRCSTQVDGKIIVLGISVIDSVSQELGYVLTRFRSDGKADTTFGDGGFVVQGANQTVGDMALQPDGKILVSGVYSLPTEGGLFVHRYNNNVVSTKEARLHLAHVRVFPNPASEQASVQFELDEPRRLQIDLLDVHGRLSAAVSPMRLWEAGQNTFSFDLPSLPKGLYWLRFSDEHGRTSALPVAVQR